MGDQICIQYLSQRHYLEVREVDPGGAASIIETDCNVDFDEPVGYKDSKYAEYERVATDKKQKLHQEEASAQKQALPPRALQKAEHVEEQALKPSFVPFAGSAKRIDGKTIASDKGGGAVIGGSSSSSSSSSNGGGSAEAARDSGASASPALARKSLVGKKWSKTGSTMSAFGGAGNSLK